MVQTAVLRQLVLLVLLGTALDAFSVVASITTEPHLG